MRRKTVLLVMLVLLSLMGCKLFQAANSQPQASDPLEPLPNEASMSRGEVTISSQELLIMESYPLQVALLIEGTLPTPCHMLRVEVSEPDDENRIMVEAYSLVDPTVICAQVLQEFDENIPLGSYPDGTYTVLLNGEEVGEFTQ
jgi:inhibitor of cysteine peptidase